MLWWSFMLPGKLLGTTVVGPEPARASCAVADTNPSESCTPPEKTQQPADFSSEDLAAT